MSPTNRIDALVLQYRRPALVACLSFSSSSRASHPAPAGRDPHPATTSPSPLTTSTNPWARRPASSLLNSNFRYTAPARREQFTAPAARDLPTDARFLSHPFARRSWKILSGAIYRRSSEELGKQLEAARRHDGDSQLRGDGCQAGRHKLWYATSRWSAGYPEGFARTAHKTGG
jgi:hypothetical protein